MSYYSWGDEVPDQRMEPPEMKEADEKALEYAEELLDGIRAIEDKVETFFEELTAPQIAKLLFQAEGLLDDLEQLSDERTIVEEDYQMAKYIVDEIESYLNQKQEEDE